MKKEILIFLGGAAIGSLVTWRVVSKKYEALVQEELESVRNLRKKFDSMLDEKEIEPETKERISTSPHFQKPSIDELYSHILQNNYAQEETIKEEKKMKKEKPYVIPPDIFGDEDEYETVSLTYYADRILTDELDEIVEDPEELVGNKALDSFGEYEDDSVFVRDDILKIDYEILLDARPYYADGGEVDEE